MPARRTARLGEYERKTMQLYKQVKQILDDGGHLVFLDESIFKARDFQRSAWAASGENIKVEDRTSAQPCQAVCAAVCKCHRLLTYAIEDYSFNQQKFLEFLEEISASVDGDHVYIFLDNCTVHHGKQIYDKDIGLDHWKRLNLTPVWNVAYKPEYNAGVEMYWAQLKATFRPLLL